MVLKLLSPNSKRTLTKLVTEFSAKNKNYCSSASARIDVGPGAIFFGLNSAISVVIVVAVLHLG